MLKLVGGFSIYQLCYEGYFTSTGICLANVQVIAGDSRDPLGRGRFFTFKPVNHLVPGTKDPNFWYWIFQYFKTDEVNSVGEHNLYENYFFF